MSSGQSNTGLPVISSHQHEAVVDLLVRMGFRLGLSRPARTWHTAYTRMNPWGKGGFIDRTLERLAFFE